MRWLLLWVQREGGHKHSHFNSLPEITESMWSPQLVEWSCPDDCGDHMCPNGFPTAGCLWDMHVPSVVGWEILSGQLQSAHSPTGLPCPAIWRESMRPRQQVMQPCLASRRDCALRKPLWCACTLWHHDASRHHGMPWVQKALAMLLTLNTFLNPVNIICTSQVLYATHFMGKLKHKAIISLALATPHAYTLSQPHPMTESCFTVIHNFSFYSEALLLIQMSSIWWGVICFSVPCVVNVAFISAEFQLTGETNFLKLIKITSGLSPPNGCSSLQFWHSISLCSFLAYCPNHSLMQRFKQEGSWAPAQDITVTRYKDEFELL